MSKTKTSRVKISTFLSLFMVILNIVASKKTSKYARNTPYRFSNPALALQVLSQLDVFVPVDDSYFGPGAENYYHKPNLGLINEDDYCEKQRAFFVEYPEIVFNHKTFMLERRTNALMTVVEKIGKDVMPWIGRRMPEYKKKQFLYRIRPEVDIFFSSRVLNRFHHVGKHYACLAQGINHIPGHYSFKFKDHFAAAANKYEQMFQNRSECFNFDKYYPKTWLLHQKDSCKDFFSQLNTKEHKDLLEETQVVFIKKEVNSHRGVGVTPLKARDEKILSREYKNGSLCGKIEDSVIVQRYIHNPLLLNGKKFDFRMYLLVASTNPLMVYYHDGELRVSLYDYNINSTDKKVLLTNLDLNHDIYEQAKEGNYFNGLDEEGLRHAQQWNFERLQQYLLDAGIICDPNWLDNYLRPEFKKAIIHLMRMTSSTFLRSSSVYELYGVDFLMDNNMNLWFIEANAGPMFDGSSQAMKGEILTMLEDHFEIIFGLLRSRMKRVVDFVNKILAEGMATQNYDGSVKIRNLEMLRKEFAEVIKNKFEPEFEVSANNTYSKIIDENLEGVAKYHGFVDEKCL